MLGHVLYLATLGVLIGSLNVVTLHDVGARSLPWG